MKTFKEFLSEKITHRLAASADDVETIKSLLEKNCSSILKGYRNGNLLLYRGVDSERHYKDNSFVMGHSRQDRHPTDMSPQQNDDLHAAFLKLGLKATRKNSIFITSNYSDAKNWGKTYVIFPFDSADYTWFNLDNIDKEYTYYSLKEILAEVKFKLNISKQLTTKSEVIDFIADEIKEILKPSDTGLDRALKQKQIEVLVNGDYYAISTLSYLWNEHIETWLNQK